jgi:signal transduction histidine kinase
LDPKVLLGAFRIVEQALLNSLVHGPASHVQVSIAVNQDGVTRVCVSDDGPGASSAIENSGVGTAVIDSWVSILNGVKNVESVPGHGYLVSVEVPPERRALGNSGKPAKTSKHLER